MTIYLSGAMSGRPNHNYDAFDLTEVGLRDLGFEVVSPAQIGRLCGVDEYTNPTKAMIKVLLISDLTALADCDAVYLLPGWEESRGVDIEVRFARYFGIPVFESVSDLLAFREAA